MITQHILSQTNLYHIILYCTILYYTILTYANKRYTKHCIGHGATVLGEHMYVLGGNDISETFGDFWRISLTDLVDYAERQWEMESANNASQNNSSKSVKVDDKCDLNKNADDCVSDGNKNNKKEKENEKEAKTFKRPVWERLSRNCALDGKPIKLHLFLSIIY